MTSILGGELERRANCLMDRDHGSMLALELVDKMYFNKGLESKRDS